MKAKYIPDKGVPPMAELPEAENVDTGHVVRQYLDGEYDLICILGPTASGKTDLAVSMAKEIGKMSENGSIPSGTRAEIISGDSRQVLPRHGHRDRQGP